MAESYSGARRTVSRVTSTVTSLSAQSTHVIHWGEITTCLSGHQSRVLTNRIDRPISFSMRYSTVLLRCRLRKWVFRLQHRYIASLRQYGSALIESAKAAESRFTRPLICVAMDATVAAMQILRCEVQARSQLVNLPGYRLQGQA